MELEISYPGNSLIPEVFYGPSDMEAHPAYGTSVGITLSIFVQWLL